MVADYILCKGVDQCSGNDRDAYIHNLISNEHSGEKCVRRLKKIYYIFKTRTFSDFSSAQPDLAERKKGGLR